ncbi:MAG: AAA family ATPase [Acholeplasmatales bacterium]|nr:AAA family ATPase [Acholeplasmatales bacterium]
MIKKLTIHNFRSIKNMAIMLNEKTTIISGQNELGKSTILNALSWFFTGKLLTDKWGYGENDIDTIVPDTLQRGEITYVEVEFASGTSYRKTYVATFNDAGKRIKHETKTAVNAVAIKSLKEFEAQLQKELNYVPHLRCIDESRLFTDPLYALQKINPNDLRRLLIELGAVVENEEVYQLGDFAELKQYESKYKGDFQLMKTAIKGNVLTCKVEVKRVEDLLETVSGITEFNPTKLNQLEAEKRGYIEQIANLKNAGDEYAIKSIDLKINEIHNKMDLFVKEKTLEHNQHLNDIKNAVTKEEKRISAVQQERSKVYNDELETLKAERSTINNNNAVNQVKISSYEQTLRMNINLGTKTTQLKSQAAIELATLLEETYEDVVTCPHCNHQFVVDEEKQLEWQANHDYKVADLQQKIKGYDYSIDELRKSCEDAKLNIKLLKEQNEINNNRLTEINMRTIVLQNELSGVMNDIDTTKLMALKADLVKAQNDFVVDTSEYDHELDALYDQKEDITTKAQESIETARNELEALLANLTEPIDAEHDLRSKWAGKLKCQVQLQAAIKALNDEETLLAKVNAFLKKYMELLNQRATELTGFTFVMQEENLSNDNMKDVCYALIDGIEFSNINTSKKYAIGIKFIERIKDILSERGIKHNLYPILADRMEGFDFIEKIQQLATKNQLICTRVSTDEEITII